jgi:leucyl-tRNA synthetase
MKHTEIEPKWQKLWDEKKAFQAEDIKTSKKQKYYALPMFPYPSGSGLHMGHIAAYTPGDIVSRFKRTRGFNVLHPMGYDAFGLPAEQFAIQTGVHPEITTNKSIDSFRTTLKNYGFAYDWSREVSTADPNYYKWTQFIFLKLFEKGLAYQKEVPVNWCPALKTVLANDEVIDGKSERGGHPVIRKPMKQWMLKITDYAERLLNDLDGLDWPERTKDGQRNWIGKSEGAVIQFKVKDSSETFDVFTTRPDTLFGVSFMVMAPEHPLVKKITGIELQQKVLTYIETTATKSELDRKSATEKSGEFTGAYAIHPLTGKEIPIWISDYVLVDYGSGAIMAVPGHDERDFEFAQKFNLPIPRVLKFTDEKKEKGQSDDLPFTGEGILCNSEFLDGLEKSEALKKILDHIENKKLGQRQIQYKLRDWLFSRQRYWGEPFPIYVDDTGELHAVPAAELPVTLPAVANYEPNDQGEAPLANNKDWVNYKGLGHRITDTMPGAAGSSWYFLRYTDPNNSTQAYSPEAAKFWMPVDLYVGGPEHTVGHLLYARFWNKVLFDAGLSPVSEPFKKLAHQGMILGEDGEKMSKSRGNVIAADDVARDYGVDVLRCFVCFLGPMDKDKPWSPSGIDGVKRFLDRAQRLALHPETDVSIATQEPLSDEVKKILHKSIKKITADIESLGFNTCISQLMILVNELTRLNCKSVLALKPLAQLLQPFAPHLAEEIWHKLGGEGFVVHAAWPTFDPALCVDDVITMGVQVNGKMRGTIEIAAAATEEVALAEAMKVSTVLTALNGKTPTKIIYKAGKILNLIGT